MAVRISSVNEYLQRTTIPGVPLTVCGWSYMVADRNDYSTIFSFDNFPVGAGGTSFSFQTQSDGTDLGLYNGSASVGSRTLSPGQWFFWAVTLASDERSFVWYHANQGDESLYSASGTLAALAGSLRHTIGNNGYSEWLDGRFAYIREWSAILDSAELLAEMGSATPVRTTNLWASNPLLVHTDLTDTTGNGRSFTGGGTLTTEDGPDLGGEDGPVSIDGQISSLSTVAGTLSAVGYLEGSIPGSSVLSGTLISEIAIEGSVSGESSANATLIAVGYLVSQEAGASSVSGSVSAQGTLSGSLSGTSTAEGSLFSEISIQGSVSGETDVQATLKGIAYLEGNVAGNSVVSSDPLSKFKISGSVSGSSELEGTLSAVGHLSGSVEGTSSVSTLAQQPDGHVSGSAAGSSSADSSLSANGYLVGSVQDTSSQQSQLRAVGSLSGSISGFVNVSANLSEVSENSISANVNGSSSVLGTLFGVGLLSGESLGTVTLTATLDSGELGDSTPMLSAGIWKKNQPNTILFVLIDSSGNEVTGLGNSFSIQVSRAGGTFSAGSGTKSEVGNGWYKYVSTATEANTSGPVALVVTGSGIIQQNLEYVVEDRVVTAVEFTYTLTSTVGSVPIPGADISFSVNGNPANVVWTGVTDAFGVARDLNGNLPRLTPGTYYVFSYKPGYTFEIPDVETVS